MKRLMILLAMLAMVAVAGAIPAHAYHGGGIDGTWVAIDNYDGSKMKVTITETDPDAGTFSVVLSDTRTAFGGPATVTATGVYYNDIDKTMLFDFTEVWFRGSTSPFNIEYGFEVLEDDVLMVDSEGNYWYHVFG